MLSAAFASRELWQIIGLSLTVSLGATTVAALLGVSPEGQAAIGGFRVGGEQLFHPSAAAPR